MRANSAIVAATCVWSTLHTPPTRPRSMISWYYSSFLFSSSVLSSRLPSSLFFFSPFPFYFFHIVFSFIFSNTLYPRSPSIKLPLHVLSQPPAISPTKLIIHPKHTVRLPSAAVPIVPTLIPTTNPNCFCRTCNLSTLQSRPIHRISHQHTGMGGIHETNGVHTNGHTHGHTNGLINGLTNGLTNRITNGHTNAQTNGSTNGQTNGLTNGYTRGHTNGRTNGHAVNGRTNGSSGGLWQPRKKESEWFIGSIDQGTTSSRFLIFNSETDPVASHQIEFENYYPESGWHEHDAMELLSSVQLCIERAMEQFVYKGYSKSQVKAVGITNQRETIVCWDKYTGEPLCNAVVWPDTRTKDVVRDLKTHPNASRVPELCGLPLSTYPASVKLVWLLQNNITVREAYEESRLAFGTVDSWLIYRLNGKDKNVHVTDTTNASRTMFMNLHTRQYDDELLNFFGIDQKKVTLPKIVPSSDPEAFGSIGSGALAGVRIAGCLGDQASALVGQCGFKPGQAKNTYGTGCFLLYNVGNKPVLSKYGLLATIAFDFGKGREPVYALEGSIAVGGSGVKFLMNNLGFLRDSSRVGELAETVKDNGGVVFVTAFSGLFAPYWIDDAKGTLFGITQHTQRGHIARATLEATCFQTRAILEAMEKDSGHKLESLAVDGGMSNSDLTMQTQADVSGIRVERPAMRETTALGAAIAAGLAVEGCWSSLEELTIITRKKPGRRVFKPQIPLKKVRRMYANWERAVEMSRGWVHDEHYDDDSDHGERMRPDILRQPTL
ncbi:glycerol kinase [Xylariaceae sp. FL0662B]|nr:glycerol kinase [Xylariaceae sp. FL0662B]